MPVIGFLSLQLFPPTSVTAFREGLAEVGYIEGKNVAIEFRSANLQNLLLPRLAADLVDRKVAVIVAAGASAATTAKAATSTIPIVFTVPDDPRKDGLVASLNRPEGNLTGINFRGIELARKRLSLLSEMVSKTATIAYLSGSTSNPTFEAQKSDILAAAHALGRDIFIALVEEGNFDAAFATTPSDEPVRSSSGTS